VINKNDLCVIITRSSQQNINILPLCKFVTIDMLFIIKVFEFVHTTPIKRATTCKTHSSVMRISSSVTSAVPIDVFEQYYLPTTIAKILIFVHCGDILVVCTAKVATVQMVMLFYEYTTQCQSYLVCSEQV